MVLGYISGPSNALSIPACPGGAPGNSGTRSTAKAATGKVPAVSPRLHWVILFEVATAADSACKVLGRNQVRFAGRQVEHSYLAAASQVSLKVYLL